MQQGYQDPRETLALSPMSAAQVRVIAVTVGLCALDGFDVLAISFASPGIAHEWGINRAALGVVLSMELLGMAIGAILVGGLADRIGPVSYTHLDVYKRQQQGTDIVPIPGTKRRAYLEENVAAATITLTPAELQQLSAIGAPGSVSGARYAEAMSRLIDR